MAYNNFIISDCYDLEILTKELNETRCLKKSGWTDISNKELRLQTQIKKIKGVKT